jgi:chromosome segregation protein
VRLEEDRGDADRLTSDAVEALGRLRSELAAPSRTL